MSVNYRFRKKPVEIEAFQMTLERIENNVDWPEWLHEAWQKDRSVPGAFWRAEDGTLAITTLEGVHAVSLNDFIIQGVKGELYPCKPDIFAATYTEVMD